ncbi:phosphodiester glycosidase family protein [Streptomyces sp. H27-H1]|uniref:phosphodiester glycosidase family protein n=1 Tax=Streptomyces sp. H27-H1 TaxID=2996461 RepID=UPI002270C429|nr:phosphodiester glycosidase family protein [Streptomyces sp. H27-H1]MCY0929561.1 phosphodiester glycosidase family protein [Streptomyces sp. H27-H1]
MATLRPLLPVLLPTLLTALLVAPAPPPAHASGGGQIAGIETARTARQIAPGVRLESYDRLEADRWLRIDELDVQIAGTGTGTGTGAGTAAAAGSGVRAEYLGGRGAATVSDSAARHPAGPGRRVVAAVNGDFFDIRGTGAPLGPGIGAGRLLHAASPGSGRAVAFDAGGLGRVLRLALDGSVTLPGGAVRPLAGFNTARPPAEGFAAYTADWPAEGLPASGPAVELRDGRVAAVRAALRRPARRERPAPGTILLFAAGAAAPELAALRPGDAVAVAARPVAAGGGPLPVSAVGGREALVVAGVPQNHDGEPNNAAAPRTAVGFSRDGRRARLVTVDGRQRDSGGLTLTALGRMMHRLGAYEALNLDGGGSSTLLAALTGETALTLENSPSDGRQRPVPNGLVLTVPAGSGRAAGYRIEPVGGAARAFPGLTRTLRAIPHTAHLGPVPAPQKAPVWSLSGGAGRIDSGGGLRASAPGPVEARAELGAARGALRLDVLGPVTRIRAVPERIGLAEVGERARFVLTGYDAQGAAAVVEPRDVQLDFDRSRWSVADDGRGGFTVTARVPNAAGQLRATVRGASGTSPARAELALGVGLSDRPLADLQDVARWTGPGAAPGEGRPGRGLALAPPTGGGAAAAAPPRPLWIPELARSLSVWVKGDGSGARPAVELADGDGAATTLRGPAVDWTGWREISLPLPAMAERPFTVTRLSATAPAAARARAGVAAPPAAARLVVDTLAARTPPTGVVRTADAPDPIVATAARVDSRPWRFAVEPAGVRTAPAGAARTTAVDFALTGTGRPAFVHRGVRFLPPGSTRRTLDGGGLERIKALRAALAAAAGEPGTGAVAVVQPYAPQAVDRKEAALRLRCLAEFRRTTGKRAVVITVGAPRFAAGRTEGVLTLAAPRTGRTVVGADAFAAGDWLSVLPAAGP